MTSSGFGLWERGIAQRRPAALGKLCTAGATAPQPVEVVTAGYLSAEEMAVVRLQDNVTRPRVLTAVTVCRYLPEAASASSRIESAVQ
jgi:hypothetical protein